MANLTSSLCLYAVYEPLCSRKKCRLPCFLSHGLYGGTCVRHCNELGKGGSAACKLLYCYMALRVWSCCHVSLADQPAW